MYRAFTDLNVGFSNAENYRRRENKELLARYFVRDQFLERLLDPNVYFLVGEKAPPRFRESVIRNSGKIWETSSRSGQTFVLTP